MIKVFFTSADYTFYWYGTDKDGKVANYNVDQHRFRYVVLYLPNEKLRISECRRLRLKPSPSALVSSYGCVTNMDESPPDYHRPGSFCDKSTCESCRLADGWTEMGGPKGSIYLVCKCRKTVGDPATQEVSSWICE